ncbi:MAG TPA: methyltransferase domain-containing protein [Pirellulales bacterium]|nr:methyltransferase domain-containing protein [Pirellulales bacterium]
MCKHNSWSDQYRRRRDAARTFGRIYSLPLVKRVRDVLLDCVRDHTRVLEVGAGDRRMGELLRARRAGIEYRSLDIDPNGDHDYHDFADIEHRFDCVFAFEVVEHVAFDELPGWLRKLSDALEPGGRLLLSTPNTFYPPAYLRDASHRTPLCYDELAGLVAGAGFDVSRILRVYHDPLHRAFLRRYLFGWLFRLIGIDFARQIVLVAVKPN